ncbi:MAG: hypothetical protein U0837_09715 [Dehalococcoidia bacterium]|jgi:hypothetical protein
MFNQPSALQPMLPGEPTPEALHREEYFNEKTESTDDGELLTEPRLQRRARLLRAQVVATVGRYFA